MNSAVRFVPVPAHPESPKLGCMPIRGFLIVWCIVWSVIYAMAILGSAFKLDTNPTYYISWGLGLVYHVIIIIGSTYYHNTVLRICQVISLIWGALAAIVLVIFLVLTPFTKENYIEMELDLLFTAVVRFVEFICLKCLRDYVSEMEKPNGNLSMA